MRFLSAMLVAVAVAVSPALAQTGGSECPADVNADGVVNVLDLTQIILDWGCPDCASDINNDGTVDVLDLVEVVLGWGCEVPQGPMSTLSGTVTNSWTDDPIVGASVIVGADTLTTDANGVYSGEFPVGIYDVTFEATNFISLEDEVILFPDLPATLDAALDPVAPVIVTISIEGDPDFGEEVTATAMVEILDGSTIQGYAWTQMGGTPATIGGADTETATVGLADTGAYKDTLVEILAEPPIGPEQLPPNVPPPDGEFPGGLQNRFQVVGMSPFSLEEAGLLELMVEVTTTSGVYDAEEEIHTSLPWKPTAGIRNVALGIPVLLQGKEQAAYDWMLTLPPNATATMIDPTTRNPWFTPDWPGLYTVTVTDEATGTPVDIQVHAGNWRGVIVGQDADGRPVGDTSCTGCHSTQGPGGDQFTPWAQTGHAEIFTDNLNSSPYWGPQCFSCHTVGYDPEVANSGIDEVPDYDDFLNAGLLGNPSPDNWSTVLANFPWTAQLANIQCENCHGPQWGFGGQSSPAHGTAQPLGEPRVSISSDVCATCHGEPLRHGRFQQWQLSGHANYELAVDEGESGNCSRCHTGNGFLAWLPILLGDVPGDPADSITVTWTPDEVHPQTCVTCHDPHAIGNESGEPNNATVRISGYTPPLIAGFTAYGVGRGAICMTCHNSRRGLRNDSTFDDYYQTSEAARAPHGSAQTDVRMGENAYMVLTGFRGNHSFLADTCATCHMEQTPPPDDLSYNQGGTNHTFYASIDICADCHGPALDGELLQAGVEDTLHLLQDAIEVALIDYMAEQIAMGNTIDLNGEAQITDVDLIADLEFGEYRGRQSITVTFTDDTVVGPYRLTDVDILDPGDVVLGPFYDFADPELIKAGWNWALVHNDGSMGVHNPTFAYQAMTAALDALDPFAPAVNWPSVLQAWSKSAQSKK